ncbi:MAG: hypothetical protein Q7S33_05585 [Nanoarchaeota archaeon]|nr:hypothetical protein [Nanoarchaeota archaeon]
MEEKIINKYDVPGVGQIELIHNTQYTPYGRYYAKIKHFGEGMGSIYCTAHSNNEEESKIKIGESVERILRTNESILEKELELIKSSLAKISLHSLRTQVLDSFEVKDERKE